MLKKTAWFVKRGKLILASQSYSEHMPFERKGNFEWLWMQREPGRVELLLISWSAICIKSKNKKPRECLNPWRGWARSCWRWPRPRPSRSSCCTWAWFLVTHHHHLSILDLLATQAVLNLPSTAVKPSGITTHVPEGEHCNNVVQIVPASKF